MSRTTKKRGFPLWIIFILVILVIGLPAVLLYSDIPDLSKYVLDDSKPEPVDEPDNTRAELEEEEPGEDYEREISDPFEDDNQKEVENKITEEGSEDKEELVNDKNDSDHDHESDLKVVSDGDYLLTLVTKETTLKSRYVPSNLQPIPSYMNPSYDMQLREEALWHLKELWDAANEEGVTLSIRSAYRSYATQKRIFENFADQHGEKEANRFSARPGQSEHQLGTTVDFGGSNVDFSAEFGQTDQGRWLAENAHSFGFAMSYPEGKEHITGYVYEPWHYRYIGVDEAVEWKESGLTLKEYLENQPQYFD